MVVHVWLRIILAFVNAQLVSMGAGVKFLLTTASQVLVTIKAHVLQDPQVSPVPAQQVNIFLQLTFLMASKLKKLVSYRN